MFKYSTFIAKYARGEKRYISTARYIAWYTLACIVRVVEVSTVVALVWAVCVLILSI